MRSNNESEYEQASYSVLQLSDMHVVTIGGGTGPFALLSSLKRYTSTVTAIVSMADNDGSSRRLMDEFGQLPPGDLHQALVALSCKGLLWRSVFGYRFRQSKDRKTTLIASNMHNLQAAVTASKSSVSGHSLSNLIISAQQKLNDGNLLHATADAQELLDAASRVLPTTLTHTRLCAELANGSLVCGETEIDTRGAHNTDPLVPIRRVFLRESTPTC